MLFRSCGMLPVGEGSTRMSVKFYLVAMLFILFDIEVVFLYPWAVVYKEMLADPATRNLIFFAMISFLGILFVGYLYALKNGPGDVFRQFGARAKSEAGWKYYEIDASHNPHITCPDVLMKLLTDIMNGK